MNTEILVSGFNIELRGVSPYVLQSCLLIPPVPTPEPEPENVISTPVPPGIEYEALPVINTETQIIDTSPDQLIGCANELPAGGEQQILNSLFPEAIDGDGVVNRDNNDIWTYDGSTWTNVGPTPGPQLVVVSVLPPWNEIVIILGLIKAKVSVQSLSYALAITTEAGAVAVKSKIVVKAIKFAQSPAASIELQALAPGFGSEAKLFGKVVDVKYYTGTGSLPQELATQWPASMMLLYSQGYDWLWFDKVRGNVAWRPNNATGVDISQPSPPGSISFEENGITIQGSYVNDDSSSYRAYIFKGKQDAVVNTAGSIPTTIYESDAFNIISYTGNAAVSTIGHGLGEVPALLIFKSPFDNGVVGGAFVGAGYYIPTPSDTSRIASSSVISGFTDSIVNIGSSSTANASGSQVTCYAFKQKQDQCKIGTYYGSGLDSGQVIDCGFNIGVVLIKSLTSSGRWTLLSDQDSSQGLKVPSWRDVTDDVWNERLYEFNGDNFTVYGNSTSVSAVSQLNAVGVEYLYMALAVGFYRKLSCPSVGIAFQAYEPAVSAGVSVGIVATDISLLAVPPPYVGKRVTLAAVAKTNIRLQALQATINAGVNIGPPVSEFEFKASAIPYIGQVTQDGLTYIAIVESRDGQPLESSLKGCIHGLIKDLKAAGLWDKFLTIVPMCGAKTLNGAIVPLNGRYPTLAALASNYNYNRRTGVRPTTSSGSIATNLNSIDLPAVDNHMAAYVTALNDASISAGGDLIGDSFGTNAMGLGRQTSGSGFQTRNKNSTTTTSVAPFWSQPSMAGVTRQNSSNYILRLADVNRTITSSIVDQAASPNYNQIRVFSFWNGLGNYRVPFYSIGMGLDLAVLEGIVETFLERVRLVGLPDKRILVPYKNLQIEALEPLYTGLRGVKPSASQQLINKGTVTISAGVAVSVSSASITIRLLSNIYAGQERAVILSPLASVNVEYFAPGISSGASVTTQLLTYSMLAIAPARTDSNVFTYIAAVEAADGQPLETDVKLAINNFIVGCKADGIWSAIKASCILAGARTLNGAFVPLAGTAPSNFNFWGDADPNWANVSLLLRMNGANASTTFTDSSSNALTVSRFGNAQISTAQSKFGGSSGLFDGTGDFLSTPYTSGFSFGTSDFTIEAWVYVTSSADERTIACTYTTFQSGNGFLLDVDITTRNPRFFSGPSAGGVVIVSTIPLALNTWEHVAVCRASGTVRLFVNGVIGASSTTVTDMNGTGSSNLYVGTLGNSGTNQFAGHIDELRITKGVARYTANFTPPTQTFPGSITDYDRETGLVGDGSTKYLDSNRNNNADPQNSKHLSCYITQVGTLNAVLMSSPSVNSNGDAYLYIESTTTKINQQIHGVSPTPVAYSVASNPTGFYGATRSSSASHQARANGTAYTVTISSASPSSGNIRVIGGFATLYSNKRIAFYSIGESLDLALLDTRVTTLVNAIAAAIP